MPRGNPTRRTTRLPRLLDRVIAQRRAETSETEPGSEEPVSEEPDHEARIRALEERIEHLEALLHGLQDSVHREAVRHAQDMERIETKTEPAELARAIGKHSREHGL